jgi:hypothetical protein
MQLLGLVLFIALSARPQAAPGSIEGSVLRTGTTTPIERAEVTLTREGLAPLSTLTDSKGRFSFSDVEPGDYTIRIQRDGYFGSGKRSEQSLLDAFSFSSGIVMGDSAVTNPETATIKIAASQRRTDLAYFLTAGGIVTGRVLGRAGPFAGATVSASRLDFYYGHPRLTTVKSAISDDRGNFRISWLEAGDYFIRADATYYPGSDSAAKALQVQVAAGIESSAINIPIGSPEIVKVSGIATRYPAAANRARFMLIPAEPDIILDSTMDFENFVTDPDELRAGKFELRDVRPGTYDLVALRWESPAGTLSASTGPPYVGRTRIVVGTQDVSGVAVNIARGKDLRGNITYAGVLAPLAGSTLRLRLQPKGLLSAGFAAVFYSAQVSPDGTFTIPNVSELPFSVFVTGLPADAYVADVRQGGSSVLDTGTITIDNRPGAELEVVLSSPGATIAGSVSASPQQPLSGATVVLLPVDRPANTTLLKRVNVTNPGGFSFAGLAPGSYRLLAFESIPPGAELNTTFMEAFRGNGREIVVGPGERTTVALNLIPGQARRVDDTLR